MLILFDKSKKWWNLTCVADDRPCSERWASYWRHYCRQRYATQSSTWASKIGSPTYSSFWNKWNELLHLEIFSNSKWSTLSISHWQWVPFTTKVTADTYLHYTSRKLHSTFNYYLHLAFCNAKKTLKHTLKN